MQQRRLPPDDGICAYVDVNSPPVIIPPVALKGHSHSPPVIIPHVALKGLSHSPPVIPPVALKGHCHEICGTKGTQPRDLLPPILVKKAPGTRMNT